MPSRSQAPRGPLLAGIGAAASLASLWLPWYTIKLPDLFRDAIGKVGSGGTPGSGSGSSGAGSAGDAFAGLFKGLAAALPTEITGKGWTVMSGGDVALAVAACTALLLVLAIGGSLGSGVRIDREIAGRLIALAGLVVAAIALYHVVSKPGDGVGGFSPVATVKLGIWVAAAGGLLMVVGGLATARAPRVVALEPHAEPRPYAELAPPAADGPAVPDWAGFSTPASEPEPASELAGAHITDAQSAPEPAGPHPGGVSIAPPGWAGTT